VLAAGLLWNGFSSHERRRESLYFSTKAFSITK
jgi:hypothetical protein